MKAPVKKIKKLEKPLRHRRAPVYHWDEIAAYIEAKYARNIRDWDGAVSVYGVNSAKCHHDFWRHLCLTHEFSNGAVITLYPRDYLGNKHPGLAWVSEVYAILEAEFGEDIPVLFSW